METIKEGAEIYYQSNEYQKSNSLNRFDNIFKAGVEFAQRWISVEDELPSIGDHILIKLKRDKLKIWRIFNEDDRILVSNYATHWRPIELK
jgi:hypothetical protein